MAISNTTLVLKKSGISGNTPSFLANGELAINYADGKLYYKNILGGLSAITNSLSFSNIYANGSLLLASSPSDTLNITAANSITILANTITKTIQIGLNESLVSSFVKKSGDTMTGDLNISSANVYANNLNVVSNLTVAGVNVINFTQAAFDKANAANSLAQDAYNYANTLSGSGGGTTVTITNDNTSNVTGYIAFVEATSGNVSSLNVSSNNITFNPSTGTLGVNNISINTYGNFSSNTQLLANTSMQVIDSFPSANYRSAFYQVQLETGAQYHALNLNIINNDSSANYVTYGDVYNFTPLGNFNVSFSNNTIYVYLTPTYAQTYVTYTKNLVTKLDLLAAPTGDLGLVSSSAGVTFDSGYDSDTPVLTFDYGYAA